MNYTLTVTVTKNKSAKYHYQVLDENGSVISERRSNRKYVACTIDGQYYFGRVDLVGKGDHGRALRWYEVPNGSLTRSQMTPERVQQALENLKAIAYLSPSMMEAQEGGQI